MGSRYLTDLANVCRAAGLVVHEEGGWQSRSRSSGGYNSGKPDHFMVHHTASNPSSDGQSDCNYCCYGSPDAPIANLLLARTGEVWVMAAGATNTNGKGGPLDNVAADSMNTSALSCEVANNGTGEPYTDEQQRALATLVRACCAAYAIPNGYISTHYLWAPTRKCDNTGPSRWAPPGTPGGCAGAGAWNMPAFRSDVASGWPNDEPPPEPPVLPTVEGDAVDYVRVYRNSSDYVVFRRTGNTLMWMTRAALNAERTSLTAAGFQLPPEASSNANVTDLLSGYVLVGPVPDGGWPPASAFAGHVET